MDQEMCILARTAQYVVRDWRYEDPAVRDAFDAPTVASLFNFHGDANDAARYEKAVVSKVDAMNAALCGVGSWYQQCDYLSLDLNEDPGLRLRPNGSNITSYRYALDLQELLPTLHMAWMNSSYAENGIEAAQKWIHINWLYFVLFAFVTGGRIALATRVLIVGESSGFINREFERDWARIKSIGRWFAGRANAILRGIRRIADSLKRKTPSSADS